jgi:hypothetical protein
MFESKEYVPYFSYNCLKLKDDRNNGAIIFMFFQTGILKDEKIPFRFVYFDAAFYLGVIQSVQNE